MSDVELLRSLCRTDTARMRLERELSNLPQAAKIAACRTKRRELKGRQDQVVDLTDESDAKIADNNRETSQVDSKISSLEEKLDTNSDYRVTQSLTKELEGQRKRKADLAKAREALLARRAKIDDLAEQVKSLLADVDAREEALTEDFKRAGGDIKRQMDDLAAERASFLSDLPAELARAYEKTRSDKGGIALAELDGDTCSVCRTALPASKLAALRKGPAIAKCPNCNRMMIAHDDD